MKVTYPCLEEIWLKSEEEANLFDVLNEVHDEVQRATRRYKPFNSTHEGYAIILEELDELWDEVKTNNKKEARAEAVQVAAMAIRFLLDFDHMAVDKLRKE